MRFEFRTVLPGRTTEEVFAYVADFHRAHEWRLEVIESTMSPAGPMVLGSQLREVSTILGRKVITDTVVDRFEAGHLFTFAHVNGVFPVSGTYRVEGTDDGAELFYDLDVVIPALWKPFTPILRRMYEKTVRESLAALRQSRMTAAPPAG